MKVPKNKTIYYGKKKYKPGSDLPDSFSFLLEKKKIKPTLTPQGQTSKEPEK
jgi:hypothetical protein